MSRNARRLLLFKKKKINKQINKNSRITFVIKITRIYPYPLNSTHVFIKNKTF